MPTATADTGLRTFVAKPPSTRCFAVFTTLTSPVVASTPYTYEPPATQYETFAPVRSGPMLKRSPVFMSNELTLFDWSRTHSRDPFAATNCGWIPSGNGRL